MVVRTLDLSKTKVTMIPPTTAFRPVDGRKYTLTRSKEENEKVLSIGHHFAYSNIDKELRNETLGIWTYQLGYYILAVTVLVADEKIDKEKAKERYQAFLENMNDSLQTIINGDVQFLRNFPWLLDVPIYVNFESIYDEYKKTEMYGTPRHFLKITN